MLVEIRPLPIKKWHGKTGKESFTQPKDIEALVNEDRKYETGLTDAEAEQYGKLLGADLSDLFTGEAHPTWSDKAFWVRLPNATLILDTDKPLDYVKVKLLKSPSAPQVANSMREYQEGKFPNATHVIYDEEEEMTLKAIEVEKSEEAYAILAKMNQEEKAAVLHILSNKPARKQSINYINGKLGEYLKADAVEFLRVVRLGREEVTVRAKVLELLFERVLTKEAGAIYYMGEMIAFDYEDAVRWFKDPNNSKMKVLMMEQLENK